MTVEVDQIAYKKSLIVTDTDSNGGRMSDQDIISGAKHSVFPRVTDADRTNGVTRYRKMFWKNESTTNEPAYDVLQYIETPSTANDRFYFREGSHNDVQADIVDEDLRWIGVGALQSSLFGGETEVSLIMESSDFYFPNGGTLHISDKVMDAQVIHEDVTAGDSVQFIGGVWRRTTASTSITYPMGAYLGNSRVMSIQPDTHEEWLAIAENRKEDVVGLGDGTVTPSMTGALNATKGISKQSERLPILQTKAADGSTLEITFDADGQIISGGSGGQLNMEDGSWSAAVTWEAAPATGEEIKFLYNERAFSYTGNNVVVSLDDQVANSYGVINSYASPCVGTDTVTSGNQDLVVSSVGGGTFDNISYPITCFNIGCVYDLITLTFTSGNAFTASGLNSGTLGAGSTLSDFTALKPGTSQEMFTVPHDGFGGTFSVGDKITFQLIPSSQGIWLKEVVPANSEQQQHNICTIGSYWE